MPSANPKTLIIPILVVVVIVGVLALAAYFRSDDDLDTADISSKLVYDNALADPINDQDWVRGATENYRLTITVFSDFQCPACSFAHENILSKLTVENPDDLRLVFRHFPLSAKDVSYQAALAAEAAGEQGKFWEMTDLIFRNSSSLDEEALTTFASQLELDVSKFSAAWRSDETKEKVDNDRDSGIRSGVDGTPAFYLNGEKYDGKISYEALAAEVSKRLP